MRSSRSATTSCRCGSKHVRRFLQDVGWLEVERSGRAVWNDANELVLEMLDTFFRGAWPDGVNR